MLDVSLYPELAKFIERGEPVLERAWCVCGRRAVEVDHGRFAVCSFQGVPAAYRFFEGVTKMHG